MKNKTRTLLSLYFSILSSNTVMAGEIEGRPSEIRTPARPVSHTAAPLTPFTPCTMALLESAFCSPVAPARRNNDTASSASMAAFLAHGKEGDVADWLTDLGPVSAPGAASAATISSGPSAAASSFSSTSVSSEEDPLFAAIFAPGPEEGTAGLPSLDGEVMSPRKEALERSGEKINNRIRFGKVFSLLKENKKTQRSHDYSLRRKPSKKVKV